MLIFHRRELLIKCSCCSRTHVRLSRQDPFFPIKPSKCSLNSFQHQMFWAFFCYCSTCQLVLQCLLSYYCFVFFLSEKDQAKEKEKKVKKTIPAWATLSASQLARAQKQTQMAATSRPKMDAILTEAIRVRRDNYFFCSSVAKQNNLCAENPQAGNLLS